MARVLLLSADLLFGSQVQGQLSAAHHEVELVPAAERARELVGVGAPGVGAQPSGPAVLVVDLTDEQLGGIELVESLAQAGPGARTRARTLGFYSHVDAPTRERALRAGFDMVVPRSRMAREGAALVASLAGDEERED